MTHATHGDSVKSLLALLGITFSGLLVLAASASQSAATTKSVRDGVYTVEQAKRGHGVYTEFCLSCHGPALGGGEMAPPLAGPVFVANWNGLTVGDLFERNRITMPQDRPGALTAQQNADVLAYMLSVGQYPAGEAELPRQAPFLRQILVEPLPH
jgi:mono/diheme cytochrome c family protein